MARVSALNQLASASGTTRDLQRNNLEKARQHALARRAAREGILTSQANRANQSGLQDFQTQSLINQELGIRQAGELASGNFAQLDADRAQRKSLADRAFETANTLRTDKKTFDAGALERLMAGLQAQEDFRIKNLSPEEKFKRNIFSGFLPGGASGGAVAPDPNSAEALIGAFKGATPPAAPPRRPQGRGEFSASAEGGGSVFFPAPGQPGPALRDGLPVREDIESLGEPSQAFRPGTFDVPTAEDLRQQELARSAGQLASGARQGGSAQDGIDFSGIQGILKARALGLDLADIPGTRANTVKGR
ncbi:unnamed protein product, partial [marine sediment metagenome]